MKESPVRATVILQQDVSRFALKTKQSCTALILRERFTLCREGELVSIKLSIESSRDEFVSDDVAAARSRITHTDHLTVTVPDIRCTPHQHWVRMVDNDPLNVMQGSCHMWWTPTLTTCECSCH